MDRRDAILAASDYLAETLAYYALVDENYRNQGVGSDKDLDEVLLRVYSAILDFTAQVKKDQEENEACKHEALIQESFSLIVSKAALGIVSLL